MRQVLVDLCTAGCIIFDHDHDNITGTELGAIAADFYLHYRTSTLLKSRLFPGITVEQVFIIPLLVPFAS